MLAGFPKAVPEIPVKNVETAAGYYVDVLGFHFDWGDDHGGIGGISQGDCRMFLTNAAFREQYNATGTVVIWLNLKSKQEVDELYQRWSAKGARIVAEPEDKPWRLREFRVGDLDGNQLRVFYDFSWEARACDVSGAESCSDRIPVQCPNAEAAQDCARIPGL